MNNKSRAKNFSSLIVNYNLSKYYLKLLDNTLVTI